MAKLEAELGVTLFERRPRGIELTPAGLYLQAAGRRLIAEEQRVSATLKSIGRGLQGQLHVGAEPMGLWRIVSHRIARFLQQHPKVDLELMDSAPATLLENVANGNLDLAVIPVLPEEPLPPINDIAFSTEVIAHIELVVIAPRNWDLSDAPVGLNRLREKTWVLPARMQGARSLSRLLDDQLVAAGGIPARTIPVPTVQTAASLVAAGVGVSVTSREMAAHYSEVQQVLVDVPWPDLPLGLVRRRDAVDTPIAERFIAMLRDGDA